MYIDPIKIKFRDIKDPIKCEAKTWINFNIIKINDFYKNNFQDTHKLAVT